VSFSKVLSVSGGADRIVNRCAACEGLGPYPTKSDFAPASEQVYQ